VVDIDRFKLVNDQYGHHVGDQTLRYVAETLAGNLRGGDWMARWGGEEFLVCFHDLDTRGAMIAGERLRKLIKSKPLRLPQGEMPITVSIGIALYQPEVENIDTLLTQADSLLYEAKQSGRDKVLCMGMAGARQGGVIWEGSQVQSALHEQRIIPAFQAIVDLRTGRLVAEEALARIITRDNNVIAAGSFIQAAEALHLVSAIDRTIAGHALARGANSLQQGAGQAHFINLSPQFLANQEEVRALLDQAQFHRLIATEKGINPMVIEITERQSAEMQKLKQGLRPLLDAGFRLALDDFGSGYSSFLYLAELPVNFLKIEGWMVSRIVRDKRVRQLVETLVNTAQRFKVLTVAECVEDAETAQVLCDIGVDWAQGYYFARPEVMQGLLQASVKV
jgi:diguanylate cyclase (GGDEF)-like protein